MVQVELWLLMYHSFIYTKMAVVTKLSNIPEWFKPSMQRRHQVPSMFPDFDIPSNKIAIWNSIDLLESNNKNMSYKGWNVVTNRGENLGHPRKPGSKSVHFLYDPLFRNIASSLGYSSPAQHWNNGVDDPTAREIASHYLSIFSSYWDYLYVNGEFWGNPGIPNYDINNIARVIRQLGEIVHEAHPTLKIGWWNMGYYSASNFANRSDEQWVADYINPQPTNSYIPWWAFASWDISECDGYAGNMKNPNEKFYSQCQVHEASRNFVGEGQGKKYITTWWEKQEVLPDGGQVPPIYYRDIPPNRGVRDFIGRPAKTSCNSFNTGLLHFTCLNGIQLWGEPYNSTLDKRYYLYGDGEIVSHPDYPVTFYDEVATRNLNWFSLGMWMSSIPQAKEIIELSDEWILPNFSFNGHSITGNQRFPVYGQPGKVLPNGIPIVRLKYNANFTKALIVAFYPLNPDPTSNVTINVVDPDRGLNVNVTVKGAWADLYHIEL